MRLDPANRSFTALAGISVVVTAYALCGMVGYVLVPLITGKADVTRVMSGTSPLAALPFLMIATASILMGARTFLAQAHSARTLVRRIDSRRLPGSSALGALACEAGLSGRLVLLEAADRFSFTYGLLSPRVAVSTGMLNHTTSEEIRAVLEHERYHVHNLDPLKSVLAHTASAALFLLPALGGLRKRYMVERELAADEHAARVCGRAALASALLKTLARPAPHTPSTAVGLGEPDALNARIAQLERRRPPRLGGPTILDALLSLAGVAALTLTFRAALCVLLGTAAAHHTLATAIAPSGMLDSVYWVSPIGGASLLAYAWLSRRARQPIGYRTRWR